VNRERHRYWQAYIADLQERMLLADWIVSLRREPTVSPDAGASVEVLNGRRKAHIWLCEDFDDCTRATQRHAVVHELMHLHLHPLQYHLQMQGGNREDQVDVRARILRGHRSHEEYAVDDLARIIAPHMPLPPKVAKP
jgi:hypothetical protein